MPLNLSQLIQSAGDGTLFTFVQNNSASWDEEHLYVPLSGASMTGSLSTTGTFAASGARVITALPTDATPVFYVTTLAQSAYDALGTKNPNTLYFII
jgi:hypothetical protein